MGWKEALTGLRIRSPFAFDEENRLKGDQISLGRQAFVGTSGTDLPDINPDTVIAKRGIAVYREMYQRDEQVKAAVLFKILARLSTGFEIVEGKGGDPEKKDFVVYNNEQMAGSMNDLVKQIWDASVMGFSAVEKIYGDPYEGGPFSGKRGFARYHPLLQEYTELKSDRWGNLLEDGVWQWQPMDREAGGAEVKGQYIQLPTKDFIVYSHNKIGDNYHGESDLRAAYRYYILKDTTLRAWGYYLETYGQPFLWAENAAGSSTNSNVMLGVLEKLRKFGAAVFPRGFKVNMQLPTQGASSRENFVKLIETSNRGIARSFLLPSLLMEHGENGSYAQSKDQTDQFVWILENMGEVIEDIIAEQYIRPLIDMNWASTDVYPRLKFNGFQRDDLKILSEVLTSLVSQGLPVSQSWAHTKFGVPEPEEDEEVLSPGAASTPIRPEGSDLAPSDDVVPDPNLEIPEELLEKAGYEVSAVAAGKNGKTPVVFATSKRWREPTKAEIHVDFEQVEDAANGSIEGSADNLAVIIDLARETAVRRAKGKDPDRPFQLRT